MTRLLRAARLFDGTRMHHDAALIVDGDRVRGVTSEPWGAEDLGDVTLAPGFVDWHVNGGGGVLFNDVPEPEALHTMARAHARFGTTALLPTLITADTATLDSGAGALAAARRDGLSGLVGIHFEGPNLAPAKRGIHDAALMHPLDVRDLARLSREDLGRVVVTLAPEVNDLGHVRTLAKRGVTVSVGHSDATYEQALAAFDAGARAVTHLWNAMSGLHHRRPGIVGAALSRPDVYAGCIADGHHVHPTALAPFLAPGSMARMTLVTDAMATVGSEMDGFEWGGKRVIRAGGRLALEDGTLAGADIDMASSVRFAVERCGVSLADALRMASATPARMLGLRDRGHFRSGARADFVILDGRLHVTSCYVGGHPVEN